jgi:hypothetical protein
MELFARFTNHDCFWEKNVLEHLAVPEHVEKENIVAPDIS